MITLKQLTPINLLEEKAKFFADHTYNPQFVYADAIPLEELTYYGVPNPTYVEQAKEIVSRAYFGRNHRDLVMMEGPVIPHHEVTERIKAFLGLHSLENRFNIVWSSSFISRATVTSDAIKLKSTAEFRKEGLKGMLYHEIGTHVLRRINYEQQPWYKRKNKFGFGNYLITEEGLAALHSLSAKSYKLATTIALKYVAVDYAQNHNFAELWKFLEPYYDDSEVRWITTLRLKRGLENTALPGGYTKDMVYFEGANLVAKWLKENNYDCTYLYFGKMAFSDVDKALELNPNFQPLLPSFFVADKEKYALTMQEVAKENYFLN